MNEEIISAFANPVRLKIIRCLQKKSKNVTELINVCGISQSAVSQHLKKLKDAGLIQDNKEGKEIYYSLSNTRSAKIAKELEELAKLK